MDDEMSLAETCGIIIDNDDCDTVETSNEDE